MLIINTIQEKLPLIVMIALSKIWTKRVETSMLSWKSTSWRSEHNAKKTIWSRQKPSIKKCTKKITELKAWNQKDKTTSGFRNFTISSTCLLDSCNIVQNDWMSRKYKYWYDKRARDIWYGVEIPKYKTCWVLSLFHFIIFSLNFQPH